MVIKIPSICKSGFKRLCTIFIVFNNLPKPSSAKNSHCTGTITLSAATKEFTVINPKDGEQSIMIKSYLCFTSSNKFLITFSLLG